VVLSYMSIGEPRNTDGIGRSARPPGWRGKYQVARQLCRTVLGSGLATDIFAYVDRLLPAGFDGVYLDKVDEFETMGHRDEWSRSCTHAARAKAQRADFVIVSQNGDALIPDAKFRHAIDAFAREDLLYGEDRDARATMHRASVRASSV